MGQLLENGLPVSLVMQALKGPIIVNLPQEAQLINSSMK
jgi:hypothetical protein